MSNDYRQHSDWIRGVDRDLQDRQSYIFERSLPGAQPNSLEKASTRALVQVFLVFVILPAFLLVAGAVYISLFG